MQNHHIISNKSNSGALLSLALYELIYNTMNTYLHAREPAHQHVHNKHSNITLTW